MHNAGREEREKVEGDEEGRREKSREGEREGGSEREGRRREGEWDVLCK